MTSKPEEVPLTHMNSKGDFLYISEEKEGVIDVKKSPDSSEKKLFAIISWKLGVTVLAVVVTVVFSVVLYLFVKHQEDAGVRINLAGRQRMLTNRMMKKSLIHKYRAGETRDVSRSVKVFDLTQKALLSGGAAPMDLGMSQFRNIPMAVDKEVIARLRDVAVMWVPFREKLERFIATGDGASLKYLIDKNDLLVAEIDSAVHALQDESERYNRIIRIMVTMAAVTVLGVLMLFLIINLKKLRKAAERINELEKMLPICSSCKKIRIDNERPWDPSAWIPVEEYLNNEGATAVTHGICPDCARELYPEQYRSVMERKKNENDTP